MKEEMKKMNLSAYDVFEFASKHWISVRSKTLYLTNITYRRYYYFLCKYDRCNNDYDYFILFSDSLITYEDIKPHITLKASKNRLRLNIESILNNLNIPKSIGHYRIEIDLEEKEDDKELYKINLNP